MVAASAASAASCTTASGVTVVGDFRELGSGMQSACVAPGGGKYATTLFAKSGFSLTRVQRKKALCAR